ncbi:MAG TPA: flippase-like domain-containing protein [Methanoregulaceae archaeon]|nr:flippase-like domain-containing protein [Methanoregulaceae archaeon]
MWRRISALVIPTVVAVAIIAYMLVPIWSDLLAALETAIPAYFVAAVAVCVVAWALRGWRYKLILNGLDIRPTLGFAMACIFVSQTANLVIPARLGDIVRVFLLKHQFETTYSQGISSIAVERIFDIVTVALLGLISMPFFLNFPTEYYALIVVPLIGGAIFFVVLLLAGRIRTKNRVASIILQMLDEIRTVSLSLRSMVLLGGVSIVIWLVDIAVCIFVVLMFRAPLDIPSVALAIVIGNLVKAVPITPGGLGTYEFTVAAILQRGGIPHVAATLIAFIDHLIKNMVTVIGGVVSVYVFGDWMFDVLKRVFTRKVVEGEKLGD